MWLIFFVVVVVFAPMAHLAYKRNMQRMAKMKARCILDVLVAK